MSARTLPSGVVTMLFTDIEGSTKALREVGDERFARLLDDHHRLMRAAIAARAGVEVRTEGDSFFVAFARATDALAAAIEAQRALVAHDWEGGVPLPVRMGMHSGEVLVAGDNYSGLAVHVAARISDAAHGGQILVSSATRDLVAAAAADGVMLRELGSFMLKDLAEPQTLYEVRAPGLREGFPPLRGATATRSALPVYLSSFVGRDEELATLTALLGAERLVTLTGVGGVGKTRLAVRAAGSMPDTPAWFVDLAPVSDPAAVPAAAALATGLSAEEAIGVEAIVTHLANKHGLLILDNCEHLATAAADLAAAIVKGCPDVRILATAREPLGVDGEVVRLVRSLAVPPPDATAEQLAAADSVRLFVERAARGSVDVSASAGVIADICRRLDGIPLAIELAAARARAFSPEELATRLEDRLRVLTGGSRTSVERHQTMRATIDWSYDLLEADEARLFRRLSVFAGGFTLDAAETVCADEALEPDRVIDLVVALVDRSLVVRSDAGSRYGMLETIRQYAREKLIEEGAAEDVRSRHLEWIRDLVDSVREVAPGSTAGAETLDAEWDNIRSALAWALAGDERLESGLVLAGCVSEYWRVRDIGAGISTVTELLERAAGREPSRGRAKAALAGMRLLFYGGGDMEQARRWADLALSDAEAVGDPAQVAWALKIKENMAWLDADFEQWSELTERSHAAFEAIGDRRGIVTTLVSLGLLALYRGDLDQACAYTEQVIAALPEFKAWGGPAYANLQLMYALQGRFEDVRAAAEAALRNSVETGDRHAACYFRATLGHGAALAGDTDTGRSICEGALEEARALGRELTEGLVTHTLGEVLLMAGELPEARRMLQRADELLVRTTGPAVSMRTARISVAAIDALEGRAVEALDGLREVAALLVRARPVIHLPAVLDATSLALAGSDPILSAAFLGGADALRERCGMVVLPTETATHERARESLSAALSDGLEAALAAGRARDPWELAEELAARGA